MGTKRVIPVLLLALALALVARAGDAVDGEKDPVKVAAGVKAAYVLHLVNAPETRFVRWPARAFRNDTTPVMVGILGDVGDDPFRPLLEQALRGRRVGNREVRIDTIIGLPPADAPDDFAAAVRRLRRCQVLFIVAAETRRLGEILAALDDAPVLTLSDDPGFARRGGMIEFVLDENRVLLEINRGATERAGLALSAKLLGVARKVHEHVLAEETP